MVIFDLYDQMIEYILIIILCVLYDVFFITFSMFFRHS